MDKKPERKPLPSLDFLFFIGKEIERHIQSHTRANSLPPLTNAHAHGLVSLTLSQQKPKPTLPLLSLPFKGADAAASSRSRFASSFQLLSSLLLLPPASFAVVSRTGFKPLPSHSLLLPFLFSFSKKHIKNAGK